MTTRCASVCSGLSSPGFSPSLANRVDVPHARTISGSGTKPTIKMSAQSSPIGVKADNKYSSRVFQLLTDVVEKVGHERVEALYWAFAGQF